MSIAQNKNTESQNDNWISYTHGGISFDRMISLIGDYVNPANKDNDNIKQYSITIGTDSQRHGKVWKFSTSVTVRRMIDDTHGKGGIYFIKNQYIRNMDSIKQKITTEASITVALAHAVDKFTEDIALALMENGIEWNVDLHFDVSADGGSKVALKDVKSLANGSGFNYSIKPHSWAASAVSNKHTK